MDNQRRDRGRYGGGRFDDTNAPRKPEPKRDPGAYIGRMPERSIATPPGGQGRRDVPFGAVPTPAAPAREAGPGESTPPAGHREGVNATDDVVREAGQNS
jgi:hypothetical protein